MSASCLGRAVRARCSGMVTQCPVNDPQGLQGCFLHVGDDDGLGVPRHPFRQGAQRAIVEIPPVIDEPCKFVEGQPAFGNETEGPLKFLVPVMQADEPPVPGIGEVQLEVSESPVDVVIQRLEAVGIGPAVDAAPGMSHPVDLEAGTRREFG